MSARLEGYRTWEGGTDPYEDHCGPFFWREEADGYFTGAFEAEARHCNGFGALHGGMLMSFADYSLFVIARKALADQSAVTVTFNSEFVAAEGAGAFVQSRGSVVRATRQLVFVRGEVFAGDKVLMTFSGVLMKRPR